MDNERMLQKIISEGATSDEAADRLLELSDEKRRELQDRDCEQGYTALPSVGKDLPLDYVIAVGFGSANAKRDGDIVIDEQDVVDEKYATCADVEAMALADPHHDWRIWFHAPLWEAEYQRQGVGKWVKVRRGVGFA